MFKNVAWSPDGTRLVGGGEDGSVYLWESANGTRLQRLSGHRGWTYSVVWSPDGTRLASGSGGEGGVELFVWDVQSASTAACPCLLRAFTEHAGQIYAVAWSPSGDRLISGDTNGMLRWWDASTGECISKRAAHYGTIRSLRVSPDGKWLGSCGDDGAIRIWDLESGEHVRTLRHDRPYERMNISEIRGLNEAQRTSLQMLGAIEAETDIYRGIADEEKL